MTNKKRDYFDILSRIHGTPRKTILLLFFLVAGGFVYDMFFGYMGFFNDEFEKDMGIDSRPAEVQLKDGWIEGSLILADEAFNQGQDYLGCTYVENAKAVAAKQDDLSVVLKAAVERYSLKCSDF